MRCRYDLTGIPEGSVCPECGLALAAASRGAWLLPENAAAVRRMRLGLSLVTLRQVAGPMLLVLWGLWMSVGISSGWYGWFAILALATPLLAGLGHVGHLIAALPTPVGFENDRSARLARSAAQVCVVALLTTTGCYAALALPLYLWGGLSPLPSILALVIAILIPVSTASSALWHTAAARLLLSPGRPEGSVRTTALLCCLAYASAPVMVVLGLFGGPCYAIAMPITAIAAGEWLAACVSSSVRSGMSARAHDPTS
ncbi:MAG: hypothetical protein IBJ11_04740 [Phycisphaerales bacterium]|nr:hypothetical protein [Phycisphaerales bacterium]